MFWEINLKNISKTNLLGKKMSKILIPELIIFFSGEIGSGKTSLIRSIIKSLGYAGFVKSPTYNLIETYKIQFGNELIDIIHIDLYRLVDSREFNERGFREYFTKKNICFIEWPEKALDHIPQSDLEINLSYNEYGRNAIFKTNSKIGINFVNILKSKFKL